MVKPRRVIDAVLKHEIDVGPLDSYVHGPDQAATIPGRPRSAHARNDRADATPVARRVAAASERLKLRGTQRARGYRATSSPLWRE